MDSDGSSWFEWLFLAGMLLLNALLSAAEVAIASMVGRPERRTELEKDNRLTARVIQRLGENSTRLLATVRLGATVAGYFAAASVALTFIPHVSAWMAGPPLALGPAAGAGWAVFLTILLLACAMVLLGDLLPKALADHHPRSIALAVAWPLQFLTWLLFPLVQIVSGVSNLMVRALGGKRPGGLPYVREEEILTLVDAGEESGAIEHEEKEMISGILEMGKTLVREVMVPRTDLVAVEADTPIREVVNAILRAGHTRIPVYKESIDNIVGILHAKDLLSSLRDCQHDRPVGDLLRPAFFVPETKIVDDLLRELQRQRTHMAIVVDEYGGTAGLVTIEDLLEEIVGEIQDEYDSEEPLVQDLGGGEYLCDARLSVDEAEELLGQPIPDGDFDTLGGFIYERLGAIPKEGDRVAVGDALITVVEVKGVRPRKLRVQRPAAPTAPDTAAPQKEVPVDEAGS